MIFLTLNFGLPQKSSKFILYFIPLILFSVKMNYLPVEETESIENKMFNFENREIKFDKQKCFSFKNNVWDKILQKIFVVKLSVYRAIFPIFL